MNKLFELAQTLPKLYLSYLSLHAICFVSVRMWNPLKAKKNIFSSHIYHNTTRHVDGQPGFQKPQAERKSFALCAGDSELLRQVRFASANTLPRTAQLRVFWTKSLRQRKDKSSCRSRTRKTFTKGVNFLLKSISIDANLGFCGKYPIKKCPRMKISYAKISCVKKFVVWDNF